MVWNDTEIPLGYLITFRTHGTWLHGDARGSIDRFHNAYKSPYIAPNEKWKAHNIRELRGEPVILSNAQRRSVEVAVREVCLKRSWGLLAINVRTNHAHAVVSIGTLKPERALADFKASATRQLRLAKQWPYKYSPWAEKGSKRYLWNEQSIARAIDYVLNGQGDQLPDFSD